MLELKELLELKGKVKNHLESFGIEDYITNLNMPYSRVASEYWEDTYKLFEQMLTIKRKEELIRIEEEIALFWLSDQKLGVTVLSNILNGASYKNIINFFNDVTYLSGSLYKYINFANVSLDSEILSIVSLLENLMSLIHNQAMEGQGETVFMKEEFARISKLVDSKIDKMKTQMQCVETKKEDASVLKKAFSGIIMN